MSRLVLLPREYKTNINILKGVYMKKIIVASLVYMGACNMSFAADNTSQQIQLLNSQIQAQLQTLQAGQQKQIQTLNAQIQAQIKQAQSDLQAQIQKSNTQTQAQIKQLQTTLQDQIKQVQQQATQVKQ